MRMILSAVKCFNLTPKYIKWEMSWAELTWMFAEQNESVSKEVESGPKKPNTEKLTMSAISKLGGCKRNGSTS